ncbi:hypothetical protein [Streptomyces sp. NBC_00299]|uniref:hypothetical protein n=1 Tax=Streptomyces sp. NBC_00299 TaxID=2975705 RepID=UPI002E2D69B5|nr:hypothetical protein [Streptomyces sp. NBC_00299]
MTWPAMLPGAALRVLRGAAGWRALQLVLLVGGVLAVGLVCGERAYAAEGVSVGTATSSSSGSAPSAVVGATAQSPEGERIRTSTRGAVGRLVSDLAEAGARAVADPATQEPPAGPQLPAPSPFSPTAQPPTASGPGPQTPAPAHGAPAPNAPTPGAQIPPGHAPHGQGSAGQVRGQVSAGQANTGHATPAIPRPADDQVLPPVAERVIQGVAQAKVPPLASLPALPALPTAPESSAWPSWPSRPGLEFPEFPRPELPGACLPGLPDAPGLPGFPAVPGQTLPAPGAETPHPVAEVPGSVDGRGDARRTGKDTGKGVVVDYGPQFVADVAAAHSSVSSGGARTTAPSRYAPVTQAPVDHPGGVLGNRSAGDNNSSRHGDAHAVSLNGRAPLRLVPGAAARVEADEIQDRHRDIPVSPA